MFSLDVELIGRQWKTIVSPRQSRQLDDERVRSASLCDKLLYSMSYDASAECTCSVMRDIVKSA